MRSRVLVPRVVVMLAASAAALGLAVRTSLRWTAEDLAERGFHLLDRDEYDRARALLDEALELVPDLPEIYARRGMGHYRRGDLGRARQGFMKAYQLRQDCFKALYGLGMVVGEDECTWCGAWFLEMALRQDPGNVKVLLEQGRLYHLGGFFWKAIESLDKAIEVEPGCAEAHARRAAARLGEGDIAGAESDVRQAFSLDPDLPEAWHSRGLVFFRKGEHERAVADFTRAIELRPGWAGPYLSRAHALHARGELARARADLKKAEELKPWGFVDGPPFEDLEPIPPEPRGEQGDSEAGPAP